MINKPGIAILIDCWDDIVRPINEIISFLDNNDLIETVILASYNRTTNTKILNYLKSNKVQIYMNQVWELDHYLSINPHIENIYVLGVAWDKCVKIRPLGYEALAEIKNINILTNIDCTLTMEGNNPNLDIDPNWDKITDKIYYYRR
jgi:hypothetical protein